MNIQISDSWLRQYLKTDAKPHDIQKYLSLSGPSVEAVRKSRGDTIYEIEITTNRVDTMSIYGIAREAAAILPRFGIKTTLKKITYAELQKKGEKFPVKITPDQRLVRRIMAVVIEDIKNWQTPELMRRRLEALGIRSLNTVVDITNYVMLETGHPTHAFDLDKLGKRIVIRQARKGEVFTGLDGKVYTLPGGDIVFDDGTGKIVDLPGILGAKNTAVEGGTKKVLFFIDNNNSIKIRRSSMSLGIRSMAAILNEKEPDPELAEVALVRGMSLFVSAAKAKVDTNVLDIYPAPYKQKTLGLSKDLIDQKIGVDIGKSDIKKYLTPLGFSSRWSGKNLTVDIPSFRANDISAAEDIIEEIARIYGYHNIPANLMAGALPQFGEEKKYFDFERRLKSKLQVLGAVEVYTQSLIDQAGGMIKLKNPLGAESAYLRQSLKNSLVEAARDNLGRKDRFHLFEMANVYLPRKNDLPEEVYTLSGIFYGYDYRVAKGVVQEIDEQIELADAGDFYYYVERVGQLRARQKSWSFTPIPKYPAQIEDITFELVDVQIGRVIEKIKKIKFVNFVDLTDIYQSAYTLRIHYQHPDKTLTDSEVEKIRKKIISTVEGEFGGKLKS